MDEFSKGAARGAGGCLGFLAMGAVVVFGLVGCWVVNNAAKPPDYSDASWGTATCAAAVTQYLGAARAHHLPSEDFHVSGKSPAKWRCKAIDAQRRVLIITALRRCDSFRAEERCVEVERVAVENGEVLYHTSPRY